MAVFVVKGSGVSLLQKNWDLKIDGSKKSEKWVQKLCGKHLEMLLGIHWLKDEFKFESGRGKGPRADCVGLGARNHPVIIEYKKWSSEEAVTQIINYAHKLRTTKKEEFEKLVEKKQPGTNAREKVDWSKIRLISVARLFSAADVLAAERFNQNLDGRGEGPYQIELIQYTLYENHESSETLLEFEEVGLTHLERGYGLKLSLERYKEIVKEEDPDLFNAFNDLVTLIESNKDRIKKGEPNIKRNKLHELIFYRQKDGEEFAALGMDAPRQGGKRNVEVYAWFAPLLEKERFVHSDNKEPASFLEEVRERLDISLRKIGN